MAKRAHGWDEEYQRQREQQRHQDGGWMDGDTWMGPGHPKGEFARIWQQKIDQGLVHDDASGPTPPTK
jgi:hypothetical protein